MKINSITNKKSKKAKKAKKAETDNIVKTPNLTLGSNINVNYKGYVGILGDMLASLPKDLYAIVQNSDITSIIVGSNKTVVILDRNIRVFIKNITIGRHRHQKVTIEMNNKKVLNKNIRCL